MTAAHASRHDQHVPIVPREKLDFGLDDADIPRYWMDNDPFKTRFFDAMSTLFPQGEKFFITSVREFKDDITDPQLQQEVRDFTRQEAQHSMIHRQFNDRLAAQGVDIDYINRELEKHFFERMPRFTSRYQRLSATAALEHLTAMMCTCFFERKELLETSDPRVRAMYAWHAIEEMEHKGVAYDVMIDYAKVGYFKRALGLVHASVMFPYVIFTIQRHLMIHDGFTVAERARMMAGGLWWLFKPGGLLAPMAKHYWTYYKPGYHPWQEAEQPGYEEWLAAFDRHDRDPVRASEDMRRAMSLA
jgi:uncharacterized protein